MFLEPRLKFLPHAFLPDHDKRQTAGQFCDVFRSVWCKWTLPSWLVLQELVINVILAVIGVIAFIAGICISTIRGTHLRGSGLGTILIVIGVVALVIAGLRAFYKPATKWVFNKLILLRVNIKSIRQGYKIPQYIFVPCSKETQDLLGCRGR